MMRGRSLLRGLGALALLLAGLSLAPVLQAQVEMPKPPITLTDEQEAQYKALLPELRCLVCQNESLADSQASLAGDLRYEVRGLIAKGQSNQQVKDYLTARYGQFVLYKPPLETTTALLWAGPFLLLLLGVVLALRYARSRSAPALAPPADSPGVGMSPEAQAQANAQAEAQTVALKRLLASRPANE